jgi:hypothetical protein
MLMNPPHDIQRLNVAMIVVVLVRARSTCYSMVFLTMLRITSLEISYLFKNTTWPRCQRISLASHYVFNGTQMGIPFNDFQS